MSSRLDPIGDRRFLAAVASTLGRTGRILREPRAALSSSLALICALIVVGVAALAADHVERWAGRPAAGASMVVYLGADVDAARARGLVDELRALPGVTAAEHVSADESTRRLRLALGADDALLDGVDPASLPASVEVTLAPGVRDVVALSPMLHALRGAPGIEDVVVEGSDDDRLATALPAVRRVAWLAAGGFALLALIIAIAATHVRLVRARGELAVAHLLGAGPGFHVIPTALAGAVQGAAAAVIAVLVLWAGLVAYADELAATVTASLGSVVLDAPSTLAIAAFIGAGAGVGLLGGALAGASRAAR